MPTLGTHCFRLFEFVKTAEFIEVYRFVIVHLHAIDWIFDIFGQPYLIGNQCGTIRFAVSTVVEGCFRFELRDAVKGFLLTSPVGETLQKIGVTIKGIDLHNAFPINHFRCHCCMVAFGEFCQKLFIRLGSICRFGGPPISFFGC